MPKARKRKTPVTNTLDVSSTSSKPKASRTIIRRFHTLLKRQAQSEEDHEDIQRQLNGLGGLEAYQHMSSIGQSSDRGGGSHTLLLQWLKQRRLDETGAKLELLEVGALKPDNYRSCSSWIACSPMDLRSRHPSIREQDFLLMDMAENTARWNVISLSLVLNFVPVPKDRGRMLSMAHVMLTEEGYLFLALPLPCVMNSRYMTFDHMDAIMTTIGFTEIERKWRQGGKMAYWLYQKAAPTRTRVSELSKKVVLRSGADRNNFAVLL